METKKVNTKPVPIVITLAAAFISCVVSILQNVDFSIFVARLLVVESSIMSGPPFSFGIFYICSEPL